MTGGGCALHPVRQLPNDRSRHDDRQRRAYAGLLLLAGRLGDLSQPVTVNVTHSDGTKGAVSVTLTELQ